MAEGGIKVLVAVDGSDRAMSMIRYMAGQFGPHCMDLKLFNVHDQLPEGFRDIDKDLDYLFRISEVKAWDMTRRKQVGNFLAKAKELLIKAGFDQQRLLTEVHERSTGIARDIITEAGKGYDAVVIARRGLGAIRGMVLGSVASKLIHKLTCLPLWVVGKDAKPGPLLAAVDGSENALRFGAHLGAMIKHDLPIELFHAVRSTNLANRYSMLLDEMPPEIPYQVSEKVSKWCTEAILEQGSEMLLQAGFNANRISSKAIYDVPSRAKAIVDRARESKYGTIVLGRRGLSELPEFPMGRVTAKVLQMAKGLAICVVN